MCQERKIHVFNKRRYEEWNCILLKGKRAIFSYSWWFLNGKENKGQGDMDTEICRMFVKGNTEKSCESQVSLRLD